MSDTGSFSTNAFLTSFKQLYHHPTLSNPKLTFLFYWLSLFSLSLFSPSVTIVNLNVSIFIDGYSATTTVMDILIIKGGGSVGLYEVWIGRDIRDWRERAWNLS